MWNKIKKILGLITDILTVGRSKGWWDKPNTVSKKDK